MFSKKGKHDILNKGGITLETLCEKIYWLVRQIPKGKVATYGQIANFTGNPRRARVVGQALRRCNQENVPCHRVVSGKGGLAEAFSPMGRETHRMLLKSEGVDFLPDGRVDLSRCLWRPDFFPWDGKTEIPLFYKIT